MPDPRGALKPDQRLVVAVYQSPGPWIIDAADSKAEAAAKISPVGFLMQTVQDEHVLGVSKDMQQYMPRPHYGQEYQDAVLKELKAKIASGVQTALEAGIVPAQLTDWNKAKDQLDWRFHYYAPDPDAPAPRDYARILTLDDALILDINVSFGTTASDDGRLMPEMSAASRVYRGDTSHLIWEHEDEVTDQTSSSTLVEFKLAPSDLTNRIQALAPRLAGTTAASFVKAFGLTPSTAAVAGSTLAVAGSTMTNARAFGSGGGGGLVPMSFFQNMPRPPTAPFPSQSVSTTTVQVSSAPAAAPIIWSPPASSSAPVTAAVSSSTIPIADVSPSSTAAPPASSPPPP
jgi:hypothetical protein